ncbi:MAG: ORC1-type DNA replication protein [Nanoarchaeota archaeon]|nr:ORC1-type DNA replication protein [Nanoarchaeota archaeon]
MVGVTQKSLDDIFNDFLENKRIFLDKASLTQKHTPENIPHRDEQIMQIAKILAPCLRMEKPSNLFIYGKTGTGKTVTVSHVINKLVEKSKEREVDIKFIYLNCKLKRVADTEYRLIAQLAESFGKTVPPTGLPTDEVYNIFYKTIDDKKRIIVLVLDEIDHLINKAGDEILYNLTRINSSLKNSELTFIGISNDLRFTEKLDARVKSSLGEEEIIFSPYNALQLRDILQERSKQSFYDNVISESVISKCAAYAAREHGDARRALDLLRVAGELAERDASQIITEEHIDIADNKMEKDRLMEAIIKQPKQSQIVLYAVMSYYEGRNEPASTGDIYEIYKAFCNNINLKKLTQRRISDLISELDMLGIINARVISQGRYGRTREITLSIPEDTLNRIGLFLKNHLEL